MNKFKFLFLVFLFVGCLVYTNFLEKQAVSGDFGIQGRQVDGASGEVDGMSKVLLYFFDGSGDLVPEYRFVALEDLWKDMPLVIVRELLRGSSFEEYWSAIPSGTEIISVQCFDDVACVNFSKEFLEGDGDFERKVMMVVRSLTEIKEVDTVEILVEGESVEVRGR